MEDLQFRKIALAAEWRIGWRGPDWTWELQKEVIVE